MSLLKYDEGMMRKVKEVFPNTIWADESEALKRSSESSERYMAKLPLITIYRTNNVFNLEQYGNDSHIRRGRYILPQEDRLKAFPVMIYYQLDIYSNKREEVDDIWRELIQFFYEDPEITVEFEGLKEPHKYVCHLADTDNTTDVSSFSDTGRLHRQTITIEIRQAQMLFTNHLHKVRDIPLRMVEIREDNEHI